MKKPINKFSLVFWIVATVFLVADVPMMLAIRRMAAEVNVSQGVRMVSFLTLSNFWYETRSALLGAGQLAGFGMLIELVDRICWNGLPPEERAVKLNSRKLLSYLRHRPRERPS
jgi:hypothetical protein